MTRCGGVEVECCVDARCALGESPLWSAARGVLYWLDVTPPSRLCAWHPDTDRLCTRVLPELATGLALCEDDNLIILGKTGLDLYSPDSDQFKRLIDVPFLTASLRFNDCGCDPLGRLWTATMRDTFTPQERGPVRLADAEPRGALCCFDVDLSCHTVPQELGCPNTFAWSLDGRTMYVADSAVRCFYAWSYDATSGTIGERRVFSGPEAPGVPDGSAPDSEGGLWNARWGAGCVLRFAADGTITDRVALPPTLVTSCAFGGEALDTLYITTARMGLTGNILSEQPHAGGVFKFVAHIPGVPRIPFRGARAT